MSLRSNTIRVAATLPTGAPLRKALLQVLATDKTALRIQEMRKFLSLGRQFGVLTSYNASRSKPGNKLRFSDFYRDLQEMGYHRIEPLKGVWNKITENSVLVPEMRFEDALSLGRKYEQDAIIYKDPSGVIGAYFMKDNTATVAMNADKEMVYTLSTQHNLISKARGISFQFGMIWSKRVPWDGQGPITKEQVNGWLSVPEPDPEEEPEPARVRVTRRNRHRLRVEHPL